MKNKQVAISLEPWALEKLERVAAMRHMSISAVGALAISFYLEVCDDDPVVLAARKLLEMAMSPKPVPGTPAKTLFRKINDEAVKRIQDSRAVS